LGLRKHNSSIQLGNKDNIKIDVNIQHLMTEEEFPSETLDVFIEVQTAVNVKYTGVLISP